MPDILLSQVQWFIRLILVEYKMNKEIENYWDKVANNWIEAINQKEKKI